MNRLTYLFFCIYWPIFAVPHAQDFFKLADSPIQSISYQSLTIIGFTDMSGSEVLQFLSEFQNELTGRNNSHSKLREAIKSAKQIILSNCDFTDQEKSDFFTILNFLDDRTSWKKCRFWSFGKKKQDREFILPSKMAAGFCCTLAGALCCIIPGGQGIGSGLILTGLGMTLDGLANGEKPYYVDRDGQIIPMNKLND